MTDIPGDPAGRLRIGLMVHAFPSVSETFVAELAAGLVAAGHEVRILATGAEVPEGPVHPVAAGLLDRTVRAGDGGPLSPGRAVALARGTPRKAGLLGLSLLDRLAPARTGVTRMLAAEAPFDVVHAQFGYAGLTAARHRRWGTLRTRALVTHFRGYDITGFVAERGSGVYDRLFAEADLFVAGSRSLRDRAVALGAPAERMRVIGSPIDTQVFAPPTQRPPRQGPVRLVAIGRLVGKKGFSDAVRAVALLREAGREVRLDILGEGPLGPALAVEAAAAGVADRVTLRGAAGQAEVLAALHAAEILVAPSRRTGSGDEEGVPNVLKEALATGLPVIATRHGGSPELVVPGENGDLVPEGDPAALAAAIGRMMDDPAAWPRMGAAGRQRVVAEYGLARIVEETLAAYRQALA